MASILDTVKNIAKPKKLGFDPTSVPMVSAVVKPPMTPVAPVKPATSPVAQPQAMPVASSLPTKLPATGVSTDSKATELGVLSDTEKAYIATERANGNTRDNIINDLHAKRFPAATATNVTKDAVKAIPEKGPSAIDVAKNVGGGILAAKGVGQIAKGIGKNVYRYGMKPSEEEARALQDYKSKSNLGRDLKSLVGIDTGKPKSSVQTALDQPWFTKKNYLGGNMQGGPISKAADAKANIATKYKDVINPAFAKAKADKVTVGVQEIKNGALANISKNKNLAPSSKAAITDALDEVMQKYEQTYRKLNLDDLDKEKSNAYNLLAKKVQNGKISPNDAQMASDAVVDTMRDLMHKKLTKVAGKDTAKVYRDIGNLMHIKEAGIKADTSAKNLTSIGKGFDVLMNRIGSPIGGTMYRAGQIAGAPFDAAKRAIKGIAKGAGKLLKKAPAVGGKIAGSLLDGTFILPEGFKEGLVGNKKA